MFLRRRRRERQERIRQTVLVRALEEVILNSKGVYSKEQIESAQRCLDDDLVFELVLDGVVEDIPTPVASGNWAYFIETMFTLFIENMDKILEFISQLKSI